ncbi:ArnT family glycosyltransferase [Hymenobacter yonginensis]|uniref:Glycosyltransferase family 39 protein n=1 Tax=Hymenobacter yonginensis TaxID=748197 RepID=A0ABY7PQD5_9BACT|nr:glycosyltransferase family 39 protein [Hymenobacter yonginensis]WBO85081.1 glycosyltransferase family 39 protein [Hymenobacter yonginensis]
MSTGLFADFESPRLRVALVALVCAFSFFVNLGQAEVNLMEARNFVAAREMAAGGSWIIPTMNGALRLAKPPLPTWAVAGVIKLTHQPANPALLRLPAAIMSTLLVFFFWGLLRELTRQLPGETEAPGRTAWLGALVLASSLLMITVGREGHWDIFANSLMVGTLWALARAWNAAKGSGGWFALSGLLLGGAILSKGPVTPYAMLLPFLVAFGVPRLHPERGPLTSARKRGLLLLAALGLLVGLAWPTYLAVQDMVAPAALAVARLEATSWVERHSRPFWDYWNFAVFAGIWAPVALAVLAVRFARPRAGRYVPYTTALAWLLLSLLLLSLVPEKKERYMLPLMPPLAILMAGLLRHFETVLRQNPTQQPETRLLRIWAGLLTLLFALVPVAMAVANLPGFGIGSLPFGCALVLFWGLAVVLGRTLRQVVRPVFVMGVALTAMAVLVSLILPAHAVWSERKAEPGLRRSDALQHNPALARLPWYTLEELHIKEVWRAGRAAPSWPRSADSVLLRPTRPIAVLTGSKIARQLPATWRNQVRLHVVDSFYLDRNRDGGFWRVFIVEPK